MFPTTPSSGFSDQSSSALIFGALGDVTRLSLVEKLSRGQAFSISQLAEGSSISRQAMTKHLKVLENVGIVHCVKSGRESLFNLDPKPIISMTEYLEIVSRRWDEALSRLKSFVEE